MNLVQAFLEANKPQTGVKGRKYIEGLSLLGLTQRQATALILVYHEGHSEEQVAKWWDVPQQSVSRLIARASGALAQRGLPRPRPYGVGSRREARTFIAGLP